MDSLSQRLEEAKKIAGQMLNSPAFYFAGLLLRSWTAYRVCMRFLTGQPEQRYTLVGQRI